MTTEDEQYERALSEAKSNLTTVADELQRLVDWYRSDEAAASVVDKYHDNGRVGWIGPYRWAFIHLLEHAHAKGVDIAKFIPSATLGFVTERHMDDANEKRVIDLFVDRLR